MSAAEIELFLDGQPLHLSASGLETLSNALAKTRGRSAAKEPCGEGVCGACSVLVDGELVAACIAPVVQLEGRHLRTFQGLLRAEEGGESPAPRPELREAARQLARFADRFGLFPCDLCRDGVLLAAAVDLAAVAEGRASEALASRVCRCSDLSELVEEVRRLRELES
jgi:aerobic-type carbon monoxide dehydrogenase small subunit (CoxS/CutS family)